MAYVRVSSVPGEQRPLYSQSTESEGFLLPGFTYPVLPSENGLEGIVFFVL